MEISTTEKEYPQFVIGSVCASDPASGFEKHRAINNRPHQILDMEKTDKGLILCLSTTAKQSRLSYTHETSLNLYTACEPTVERLYVHIELWTDTVFRVTCSDQRHPADPYAALPENCRMLIGKPSGVEFSFQETADSLILTTKEIAVTVEKATARIRAAYLNGPEFFCQIRDNFSAADIFDFGIGTDNAEKAVFEALELDVDEVIYGLGERFDSVVRNGRTVDFHNKDAVGTTSRRTYVNIPFYLSTKGYGLFLNSGAKTEWEIGTTDLHALQFSVLDNRMDYFVMAGKTPKDILRSYCGLTGFSKLPPLWSFGLWMSRNSYISWDVVDEVAAETRRHDIPCDVLHLDTAWFREDWDCDLKFSQERFPDPTGHMADLKEKGFHISLWQYNFIPPNEGNTHYAEAVEHGYLAKDGEGKPYQLPETCKGSWVKDAIVDFSNPEARKWYGDKIYELIKMGAGAIKTDFGEGIPVEAVYQNVDGKLFHNAYSLAYNCVVAEATHRASGENIVWARSGTAGSQRFPLHWGGDSQCSFEALAGTLRGALSVGMSGIPFFSHDIGGFIGTPDDELYVRWAQLGLFSSHSRCHGCGNDNHREPWQYSEEACSIFRDYDKLRYSLMPYIYAQAEKCTQTGLPMMRALYLEYPQDRNTWFIEDQYLFGDDLLIAPVLKPLRKTDIRQVYLPEGVWYDYFTGEKITSTGMWIQRKVDLKTMPIYVKAGTTLRYCSADTTLCDGMGEIVREETWA